MGKIGAPFGIAGWVKVQSYTQDIENLLKYEPWYIQSAEGYTVFPVINGRVHGVGLVVQIDQVTDRDAAALFCHTKVWVQKAALAPLGEDEFYWADLEGLQVETVAGIILGQLAHLYKNANLDVMVIKDKRKEHHVPFVMNHTVVKVDLAAKKMIVDWEIEL